MTSPLFEWKGDGPNTPTGVATFVVKDRAYIQRFANFAEANDLHSLIDLAYSQGLANGQRALAQLVVGAVERYR